MSRISVSVCISTHAQAGTNTDEITAVLLTKRNGTTLRYHFAAVCLRISLTACGIVFPTTAGALPGTVAPGVIGPDDSSPPRSVITSTATTFDCPVCGSTLSDSAGLLLSSLAAVVVSAIAALAATATRTASGRFESRDTSFRPCWRLGPPRCYAPRRPFASFGNVAKRSDTGLNACSCDGS